MAEKIYFRLFIGFMVLLTFLLLFISLFLGENTSSTPTNSDLEFPIIYIALMVLGALGVLAAIVIRIWR